jgi:thiol-disulfide isomerase/thioredoxin
MIRSVAGTVLLAVVLVACARERERPPVPEPRQPVAPTTVPPSLGGSTQPTPSSNPAVAPLHFVVPPDDLELGAFLRSERLKEKSEGRLLVVYVGAPWCPPCRRFHAAAHGGELDAALGQLALLELDADRDADRLAGLGYVFKNIPYFAVVGPAGKPTKSLAVADMSASAQKQIVDTLTLWQTEH